MSHFDFFRVSVMPFGCEDSIPISVASGVPPANASMFLPACACHFHEKFWRNDRDFAVLTSPTIAIVQFYIVYWSSPRLVKSMTGSWRMNWVLGLSPTVKDETCSVQDDVILKQIHSRKWKMPKNRFFTLRPRKWRQPPQKSCNTKNNSFWEAKEAKFSLLKSIATFCSRFRQENPGKGPTRVWELAEISVMTFLQYLSQSNEGVLVGRIYPSSFSGSKSQGATINSCRVMIKSVRQLGSPTEPCGTPDFHPGWSESPWGISGGKST